MDISIHLGKFDLCNTRKCIAILVWEMKKKHRGLCIFQLISENQKLLEYFD